MTPQIIFSSFVLAILVIGFIFSFIKRTAHLTPWFFAIGFLFQGAQNLAARQYFFGVISTLFGVFYTRRITKGWFVAPTKKTDDEKDPGNQ